jgi:hypothetical protein
MAGLTESYCRSNETSHASQFKWLDNTFKFMLASMKMKSNTVTRFKLISGLLNNLQ